MIVGYSELRDLAPDELDLLPEDERNREFGSESRRQQFQCGRALVRMLLHDVTGRAAGNHEIVAENGGKPICTNGPAISITHTGQKVACCVVEVGLAGIDIERIDEKRETDQIVRRFFSPGEASWLESHPDGFFMLWVLKEAFVKAHGKSIFGGLEKLHCTVEPPAISATAVEGNFRDLCLYRRDDAYLGLATTEAELCNVEFRYWPPRAGKLIPGDDYRFVASTNAVAQNSE